MQRTLPGRVITRFMKGVMFNPATDERHVIDTTEESDCTTPEGHARLRVLRGICFSTRRVR